MEHKVVWGFFVFGSSYAGAYARALPTKAGDGVINRKQGAEGVIILEVEEQGI